MDFKKKMHVESSRGDKKGADRNRQGKQNDQRYLTSVITLCLVCHWSKSWKRLLVLTCCPHQEKSWPLPMLMVTSIVFIIERWPHLEGLFCFARKYWGAIRVGHLKQFVIKDHLDRNLPCWTHLLHNLKRMEHRTEKKIRVFQAEKPKQKKEQRSLAKRAHKQYIKRTFKPQACLQS